VVSDALSPWHAEAKRRGITLEVPSLDEAPARLDARLTGRLLGVLMHNALHYTPSGGRVEVRVITDQTHAILDVDDSGIGIPVGEREHVFERFFRGEAARQRAPEGSGLGLAIAQWIAHQHGGRISVGESELGGARFRVSFPLAASSR
jgi:signal transduction histidine kinase